MDTTYFAGKGSKESGIVMGLARWAPTTGVNDAGINYAKQFDVF